LDAKFSNSDASLKKSSGDTKKRLILQAFING